jgi:predicted nucleic acid-binding protein
LDYRYWDSCCFLCWLKKEPEHEKCKGVLELAENGDLKIVTSAYTISEVIYLKKKGYEKISREDSNEICRFFERDYIIPVNIDRYVAESARNLLWEYEALRPQDAIHVASAIKAGVNVFDTFDEYLLKQSGNIGDPPLIIGKPNIHHQESLEFET